MDQNAYRTVQQMIQDGASREEIEAVLTDEHTPLTNAQVQDLRAQASAGETVAVRVDEENNAEGCRHTTELATNGHGSYCRACGETLE